MSNVRNQFVDYGQLGTKGRRAGVEVRTDLKRDEYGMEDLNAFFDDRNENSNSNEKGMEEQTDKMANNVSEVLNRSKTSSRTEVLAQSIRRMSSRSSMGRDSKPISAVNSPGYPIEEVNDTSTPLFKTNNVKSNGENRTKSSIFSYKSVFGDSPSTGKTPKVTGTRKSNTTSIFGAKSFSYGKDLGSSPASLIAIDSGTELSKKKPTSTSIFGAEPFDFNEPIVVEKFKEGEKRENIDEPLFVGDSNDENEPDVAPTAISSPDIAPVAVPSPDLVLATVPSPKPLISRQSKAFHSPINVHPLNLESSSPPPDIQGESENVHLQPDETYTVEEKQYSSPNRRPTSKPSFAFDISDSNLLLRTSQQESRPTSRENYQQRPYLYSSDEDDDISRPMKRKIREKDLSNRTKMTQGLIIRTEERNADESSRFKRHKTKPLQHIARVLDPRIKGLARLRNFSSLRNKKKAPAAYLRDAGNDTLSEIREKQQIMSGTLKSPFDARVYNEPTSSRKVLRRIAWPENAIQSVRSRDSDYDIANLFDQDSEFLAAGMIRIDIKGSKPARPSKHTTYVFFVSSGVVEVDISGTLFRLGKGGSFEVPRGNVYSIRNISDLEPALLFYAHGTDTREMMGEGDTRYEGDTRV